MRYQQVSGDLQSGLRMRGFEYRQESLSLTVDRLELRVDLGLWPPAVTVHYLQLESLELRAATATEPGAAPLPEQWLPALSLPVPVTFRQLRVERIAWYAEPGAAPFEVRNLSLSADWRRVLELHGAEAIIDSSRWHGDIAFGLEAPHELDLDLRLTVPAAEEAGLPHPLEIHATASGDVKRSRWEVALADPGLIVAGEIRDLLGEANWDVQLTAARLQWPLAGADPTLTLDEVLASSYGTFADYGLELDAVIGGAGIPALKGRLVGTGNGSGLGIEALDLEGDALQLEGTGRVAWQASPQLRATLDVLRLAPGAWLPWWGEAEPARGRVELAWKDQRLDIEGLDLVAPGAFESLQGSGSLDFTEGSVAAQLGWRTLSWPPAADEPYVSSADGRATLGGRLDDWVIEGELALSGPGFPPGRLQVSGTGDGDSLHLEVPGGTVLDGRLAGSVDVAWQPDVRWAVVAQLDRLATAPLVPAMPGRVSGEISVRGRPQPSVTEIDLADLHGVIRERQVRASGSIALREGQVFASDLRLRSGSSSITLEGRMEGPEGLAFTASIETLADFLDGAAGSFAGSGLVSTDPAKPIVRLDGRGQSLSWGGSSISELVAATEQHAGGALRVELRGVELGETRVERLSLLSSGERPLDRLELDASLAESRIDLQLDGRVNDWQALLDRGWSGRLQTLRLDGGSLGFIALEQPVDLSLNGGALALAPACFVGSREGRLCLESTWQHRGERALEASLEDVSPNLALSLLGSDFAFTQLLSGSLEWRQQPGAQAAAEARLQVSAGEIIERGEEETLISTGPGLFGFEVADGRLLEGRLDIPITGAGGISADFSVPDLSDGLGSLVQGRLLMNMASIEPVLRLFPGIEGTS
ncbi:MAG TPA: hypothetical protein VFG48_01935, partial [Xanthomonadales bacterium]|nr:hypothetical protein [Xanthomonadales bacterium]